MSDSDSEEYLNQGHTRRACGHDGKSRQDDPVVKYQRRKKESSSIIMMTNLSELISMSKACISFTSICITYFSNDVFVHWRGQELMSTKEL